MFNELIFKNLIWTQGIYILLAFTVFGIIGFYIHRILAILAISLILFSFYFFRNPERFNAEAAKDNHILLCPADGRVVAIETIEDPALGTVKRVSIFLSPLDVHVQWTPIGGTIERVTYRPGKFLVAYAPKSSDINERNDVVIQTTYGKKILVRQIAGMVARRICWWVAAGAQLPVGTKYGMIRFGSRVDTLVPQDSEISVILNQYVYGGHTILGKLR